MYKKGKNENKLNLIKYNFSFNLSSGIFSRFVLGSKNFMSLFINLGIIDIIIKEINVQFKKDESIPTSARRTIGIKKYNKVNNGETSNA